MRAASLGHFLALPLHVALVLGVPAVASADAGEQSGLASRVQAPSSTGQAGGGPILQGGAGAVIGVPVGDFQDSVDIAGGVSGHFGVGLGDTPISVGVEGSYLWYGIETRDIPLVGLPDLAAEVQTSNDMFLLHGRVRAQARSGRVRPYVDGLVGFNYLFTRTSLRDGDSDGDRDSVMNMDDLVLSAGGGAGVMIALGGSPQSVRLDLSVRYLYGGEADYLIEGDVRSEFGPPVLVPRRSRTDMVAVYIGVTFGR
jgi:hypothetical protein